MKLTLFSLFLATTSAFQPASRNGIHSTELKAIKNPMENILRKLSNNFEPIHGHGSLEDDLEDQWQAQQELLKERKRKNIDKKHLMQKYKDPEARKTFDLNVGLPNKSVKKSGWDNFSP